MRVITPGDAKYDTLKFRLLRKATGLDSRLEYGKRTPEQTAELSERLSRFSTIDVRYFYADALINPDGRDVQLVDNPAKARSCYRVAGLFYPQIGCIEEALVDKRFSLGFEEVREDPVFVEHTVAGKEEKEWLKLRAFVAYGIQQVPVDKRGELWRGFPVESILAEADRKGIVYNDSVDHDLDTAIMGLNL